jgi:hypothetical protein
MVVVGADAGVADVGRIQEGRIAVATINATEHKEAFRSFMRAPRRRKDRVVYLLASKNVTPSASAWRRRRKV